MTRIWKKFISLLLAAAFCLAPAAQALTPDQLKELLSEYYINDLPQQVMDAESIEEIIQALGDPYTMYMTPQQFAAFQASMADASLVGIGISAVMSEEGLLIVGVYDDTPAQGLGLAAGDIVVQVEGQSAAGQAAEVVSGWLKGEEGTQVTFVIRHQDGREQTYTAKRAKVTIPATTTELLEDGTTAYISSTTFGGETQGHFVEGTMAYDDVSVWIVDLRSNGGGDVYAVTQSLGVFLGKGNMVYLRNGSNEFYRYVSEQERTTLYPAIVLTSEQTASSAEIFALAMKDKNGGMIIGSNTYGKGVAQIILTQEEQPEALSEGGALRITAFQSYGVEGNTLQHIGVIPDLLVPAEDAVYIARLFDSVEPKGDNDGWMRIHLGQVRWYVDLAQAQDEDTGAYFAEMLSATPPGCDIYLGAGSKWVKTNADHIAEVAGVTDYNPRRFSDVAGLDCEHAVNTLYTYSILKGNGDGTFHPDNSLTRAELCALLVQAMHLPASGSWTGFSDVPSKSWYAPYVKAVQAAGYVNGVGNGKFNPMGTVTNEQLITVLGRLASELNLTFREASRQVPDDTGVPDTYSSWAQPWAWLLALSQQNYLGQTLSMLYAPLEEIEARGAATRGETAQILYTIFQSTQVINY